MQLDEQVRLARQSPALSEIVAAHQEFLAKRHVGKIVLIPW